MRPGYTLVRRIVVGALRERLERARRELAGCGMAEHPGGRVVYPYPAGLIEETYRWLNSYRAHFEKANSHRLVCAVNERHPWLKKYFRWEGKKARWDPAVCKGATGFAEQRRWFRKRLPDHVLMV